MEQHIEYFDFAANLARAEAIALAPDATAGVDRYNDECARRGDMLDAAKASDIADLAAASLEATDLQTLAALSDWFIDEILRGGHAALIAHAKESGGYFTEALLRAAKAKAEDEWETRYFK